VPELVSATSSSECHSLVDENIKAGSLPITTHFVFPQRFVFQQSGFRFSAERLNALPCFHCKRFFVFDRMGPPPERVVAVIMGSILL